MIELKVKYQRLQKAGKVKSTTESYLLDAVCYSEAEEKIHKEMEDIVSGDFTIKSMKTANYSEILNETGSLWFKGVISFVSIDEEKGIERKVKSNILVKANDIQGAKDVITKELQHSVTDYEITSISESPIKEYFKYEY